MSAGTLDPDNDFHEDDELSEWETEDEEDDEFDYDSNEYGGEDDDS